MKNKTHIYVTNMLIEDLQANTIVLPGVGTFAPPGEVRDAVLHYPSAFRAGSIGPDFFPDYILGQGTIQKKNSGKWVDLMFRRLQDSSPSEREKNLAYALGFMIHAAGDMFGHGYVDSYAQGWWPAYAEWVSDPATAKIALRHILIETYMDQRVPASTNLSLDPPLGFIRDVFTCSEALDLMEEQGADNLFDSPLWFFMDLKRRVQRELAEETTTEITGYYQSWERDIDQAIDLWLQDWAMLAQIFSSNDKNKFYRVKNLIKPGVNQLMPLITIPEELATVVTWSEHLEPLWDLENYLEGILKDYVNSLAQAAFSRTFPTWDVAVSVVEEMLANPVIFLDNGSVFQQRYMCRKLDADFGNYGKSSDTTAQSFHAVQQCVNMAKLCLLGTDNLNEIAGTAPHIDIQQPLLGETGLAIFADPNLKKNLWAPLFEPAQRLVVLPPLGLDVVENESLPATSDLTSLTVDLEVRPEDQDAHERTESLFLTSLLEGGA